MVNVLIIDDEEPLREAIKILGDWEGLGVEQVLEATNGKMGLEMLKEHRIDLAIVDMKMPELSGMELLQRIENDYPDLLTIVISGYNDFEYTRQAIHSKVIDYLLKPINRHDLNQALYKAVNVWDAKRKKVSEFINQNITLNMSLPRLKEKIYVSLIERSFKNQTNEALLPLIGADDSGNRFTASMFRILNLDEIRNSRFHGDVDLLHFAVANVVNEIAGDKFQCFSFANPKQEREIIAIITMKGGYREDLIYQADHHMKKIVITLKELFGIVVVAGIGQPHSDVMDIASSYDSAKSSIIGTDLLRLKGSMIANDSVQASIKENYSLSSRIPFIRGAIESGYLHQARSIIGEFLNKWRSVGGCSLNEADRTLQELVILLNDVALVLNVAPEQLPKSGDSALRDIGISRDYASFDQFEELLNRILEYYATEVRYAITVNRPFEVGDIKLYIDNHYFEDIKISMFTEKYFLSREYLMKLFKQQFGYGIHEYVQKVRMDKAKELLDDPSLKIQDIAERLGYKDKNYFSKAFRNYYSVSPSEYRDSRSRG